MAEKYSIGIDYGTLSGRALLVRISDGKIMADAVMDYPHAVMDDVLPASGEKLPADFALEDPADYIKVLKYIVPTVMKESGVDPEDVVAIGIDFTCCTVLPVYEDGTPLCFDEKYQKEPHAYVKLWKHHAAQPYADKIEAVIAKRGEDWLKYYGGKVSSEWMFPKIMETLDKAPEVYADAARFMEAGDWITSYITGKPSKGYVFATVKAFYDMEKGYPAPDFFAELDPRMENIVKEKLDFPMYFSGQSVGRVSAKAAAELGLSENTSVSCAMPDGHVASAALGMKYSGDMCAIMGTSSCYLSIDNELKPTQGICCSLRDILTPGFYGYEAGLCCMGDNFAWAVQNLATAEYKEEAEKAGMPLIKYIIAKAAKKAPGEAGLIALNWWNGNRNILVDSSLSGLIVGMTLGTKVEDIMRALIEATAFGTRVILENYEEHGVEIKRFIGAGGIARKDPFTMQLYADVLKKDILIAECTQIPALGSAVYAASSAGYDLYECMDNMSRLSETVYHPNPEASAVYDKLYAEYLRLYNTFGRGENNVMKTLRAISAEAKGNK